ncbi:hypothetical protein [Pseudoalteromonas galatheae]|uniref:hypothetical protein n=1 Tax=Pseudoalteromonas galatheae TaxID=579562 RepID=UPI0030D262B3
MKWIIFSSILMIVSGCAINQPRSIDQEPSISEVVTIQKEFPPQIWSDHKLLDISESKCANKSMEILSSLGFVGVVKSSHGEFVYENYSNNRAAIKCTRIEGKTFVYAVVAGPKVEVVQKLRNEIMWQL